MTLLTVKCHLKSMPGATYSVVPNLGSRSRSSFKKSRGIGTRAPLVDSRRFIASAGLDSPKPKHFCNNSTLTIIIILLL